MKGTKVSVWILMKVGRRMGRGRTHFILDQIWIRGMHYILQTQYTNSNEKQSGIFTPRLTINICNLDRSRISIQMWQIEKDAGRRLMESLGGTLMELLIQ